MAFYTTPLQAQKNPEFQNEQGEVTHKDSLSIYGAVNTLVARLGEGEYEVLQNVPRWGFYLQKASTRTRISMIARMEWGVNMIENNTVINPDATTAEDFLQDGIDAFTTRQGYIGVSHPVWGTLTIGKQWSVYYDVSNVTDYFNVFGSAGSGTYNFFTDGGIEGTGRADKAIIYRNKYKGFSLGLQSQLLGNVYHYAASLRYKFKELGVTLGAAYNRANTTTDFEGIGIIFPDKTLDSHVLSASYDKGAWYFGLLYANQDSEFFSSNQQVIIPDNPTEEPTEASILIEMPAIGVELYGRYRFKKFFNLYGGFNLLIPRADNDLPPQVDSDFRTYFWTTGLEFRTAKGAAAYFEAKLDNSINDKGNEVNNLYALGLRYNFNFDFLTLIER
ncbi:porin [Algivirga pacifica]|uniref:Porin n=1 Tax=Algivirga pacifica TaxID=1162670 RepID=A0ABP9DBA2_9BACT